MNPYESDQLLSEYLLFHYGRAEEILPAGSPQGMADALGFAERTPSHFSKSEVARGLDIGCAVGRSTYEMSRYCDEVIGIDFSQNFVNAADQLSKGTLSYQRLDEGHKFTNLKARLPEGLPTERVSFEQGDAMYLRAGLGAFDRVHAANVLCRLTEPRLLLERFDDLVVPGGELIIATPCTWLGEFTPPSQWPEGSTLEWLHRHLDPHFDLQFAQDEPFLIRETARKFQWTVSQLSKWVRK